MVVCINLQIYAAIDLSQKTVTVPPGGQGLKGKLKQILTEQGWQLSIDRGPSIVEGNLGSKTKLESYDTFNTRYRLYVRLQGDRCLNSHEPANYDISFIDNKTGSEVFTIEGRDCMGGGCRQVQRGYFGFFKVNSLQE
jgi:hypothetical protein